MGVVRDLHHRCIYYPSPMRSVCEDTVVGKCVSVLALNRLIANFNKMGVARYLHRRCIYHPEHVYT